MFKKKIEDLKRQEQEDAENEKLEGMNQEEAKLNKL
jgi:hypothetical protein